VNWQGEVLELLDRPLIERERERDVVAVLPQVPAHHREADLEERRLARFRRKSMLEKHRMELMAVEERARADLAHEDDIQRALTRRERDLDDLGFLDRLQQNLLLAVGGGSLGAVASKLLKDATRGSAAQSTRDAADLIGLALTSVSVVTAGCTTPRDVARERRRIEDERIESQARVRRIHADLAVARARYEAVATAADDTTGWEAPGPVWITQPAFSDSHRARGDEAPPEPRSAAVRRGAEVIRWVSAKRERRTEEGAATPVLALLNRLKKPP